MTASLKSTPTVFLAASDEGVTRAWIGPDKQWQVDQLLSEEHITCLVNDPAHAPRLFAGTRTGKVYTSPDAGQTWQAIASLGADHPIKSLAVSPHEPHTLYAGTKPALIFKSNDGGYAWRELAGFRRVPNRWWWFSPAEPPDRRPYVFALSISPTEPGVVLAGVEFGAVSRSTDGGQTWSRHRSGALRDCHSLKFHPVHGDWVYEAGGTGGGASVSRDGGRTFKKAKNGLAKNYGVVCGADAVKPEVWYMCVAPSPFKAFGKKGEAYLYRSIGGAGWQPIGWQTHPLPVTPTALVAVPNQSGQLYAGLYNGEIWHTSDYGDNWAQMPFKLGRIWFSLTVI